MRLTLSKEAISAIEAALSASVESCMSDLEFFSRSDLDMSDEAQKMYIEHIDERLRERMGALGAFREAVSNGRR